MLHLVIVDPDCLLHQQIANGGTHLVDQIASMGLVYLSTVCLILEVNVGIYIYHAWMAYKEDSLLPSFSFYWILNEILALYIGSYYN